MAAKPSQRLWLVQRPFAHRGLFDHDAGIPENSLAAFQAAIDAKFGIELDVQLSGDKVAMVFHDEELTRLTGRKGYIRHTAQDKLERMTLLGTSERIPSLSDALNFIDGRTPVLIEMKRNSVPEHLEMSVRRALEGYGGPIGVMSFDPTLIKWFSRWAPRIPRGLVASCRGAEAPRLGNIGIDHRLRRSKAQFLAYDIRCLPSRVVRRARRAGMPCLTWTAQTPDQIQRHRHEVDGFIFEKPAIAGL